jgi:hypothetical protein
VYYKLKKVCKTEILRRLKQRFGTKTLVDQAIMRAEVFRNSGNV